jgi:NADP-dependent 3-hydroxy acid dehydrogenase YdfG
MASKVALVTGAGSGIGRAVSLALDADGWSVVLAGRRTQELEKTASHAKRDSAQRAKRKRDSAQPEDAKRKRDSAQPEDAKRKRDSAQPEELNRTVAPTLRNKP